MLRSNTACAGVCCCRCFFGDFTDKAEPTDRRYSEIPSVSTALAAVEEALADYNGTSKRPMQLAMFLYALEHVSRISRLMKQPGGHMLLIGVGGSGRQSLAKLAAFMAGVDLFQVGFQWGQAALILVWWPSAAATVCC